MCVYVYLNQASTEVMKIEILLLCLLLLTCVTDAQKKDGRKKVIPYREKKNWGKVTENLASD